MYKTYLIVNYLINVKRLSLSSFSLKKKSLIMKECILFVQT